MSLRVTDLEVKVVPGASRTEIVGRHGGGIRVRIAAPPEDGRANEELLSLLAQALGLNRSDLRISRGTTSHLKRVTVLSLSPEETLARLGL
jgi:uncharacterized protein (TIGR00251 family)